MNYEQIKEKYGWCASWAIWKRIDTKKKAKYGMDDITSFDNVRDQTSISKLNPNIVLVGLNISGKGLVKRPFSNFHPTHTTAHDYKIRYALQDTQFWGAYMTDIIKDHAEVVGTKDQK